MSGRAITRRRRIRRLALALVGVEPTPGRVRGVAESFRREATRLEAQATRLARRELEARTQGEPHVPSIQMRQPGPGRQPGDFVRVAVHQLHRKGHVYARPYVYIGRGLWYAAGQPRRVQFVGGQGELHLVPCADGGLPIGVRDGIMPRIYASAWAAQLPPAGRYQAEVGPGGVIRLGAPQE